MLTAPSLRAAAAAASALALCSCAAFSFENEFLAQGPSAIAETAFTEMRGADSLRVLGTVESKAGFTHVDLSVDGTDCTGTIDTEAGAFQLIKNGDGAWFRADERFWRSQASSKRAGDRAWGTYRGSWVVLEERNEFVRLCDVQALLDSFTLDESSTQQIIEEDSVEEVGGVEAVPLNGSDGKKRTTVWVAMTSPHRVIKMAPTDDTGRPDELYFEDVGAAVRAESPPRKHVVTLPGR